MNSTKKSLTVDEMMRAYDFMPETIQTINNENLLPLGLIRRLQKCYPQCSQFSKQKEPLFKGKTHYTGLIGFREILHVLKNNGIELGAIGEREFFLEVYRFMATKHILNTIDWSNYKK